MMLSKLFAGKKIRSLLQSLRVAGDESQQRAIIHELVQIGKEIFPHVLEALRERRLSPDHFISLIRSLYSPEMLPALLSLLNERREEVRQCGYAVLQRCGKNEILPLLLQALERQTLLMTKPVIHLLKEKGDERVIVPLQALFARSQDRRTRRGVLEVLVHFISHPQSQETLLEALQDQDWWIRLQAVDFLQQGRLSVFVPHLIDRLQDPENRVKERVIEALMELGDPRAVKPLLSLLREKDLLLRQKAIEAISRMADVSIIPDLIDLMKEEDVNTRRAAAEVIGALHDPRTGQVLMAILRDEDWWVREIAAEALLAIKSSRILQMLIAMLQEKDEGIRRCVVEVLSKADDPMVIDPLLTLLHDKDWWVRERAVIALGNIGDPRVIPSLISLSQDPEIRWVVAKALGNFQGPEVEDTLVALAQDEEKAVRREAAIALGKQKTERAVATLKALLGDEEEEIQFKAAEILKEITGKSFPIGRPLTGPGETESYREILTEAILVMDICNSTRIAAKYGDHFALQVTQKAFALILPLMKQYRVQYVKNTGDGYLMTFKDVRSAVKAAVGSLQKLRMYNEKVEEEQRVKLRFAINFGETRVDAQKDRLGVAVNMAFRLDSIRQDSLVELAPGITPEEVPFEDRILVSESVYDQLQSQGEERCTFLGYFEPKGILGRHKVFRLDWEQ
ncbi:MAG: hypothetical protein D6736_08400 [Nitrospinota bacterium]|nr:MAG: hypothetical protein D6736_08400 [Nitrospinota bacterium]